MSAFVEPRTKLADTPDLHTAPKYNGRFLSQLGLQQVFHARDLSGCTISQMEDKNAWRLRQQNGGLLFKEACINTGEGATLFLQEAATIDRKTQIWSSGFSTFSGRSGFCDNSKRPQKHQTYLFRISMHLSPAGICKSRQSMETSTCTNLIMYIFSVLSLESPNTESANCQCSGI